jgi:pentatricopeptide repeat protein
MHAEGMARDKATFMSSLNACTNLRALTEGRCIHFEICQERLELDVMIGTALVKMYGRCESLADACCIFESMMPETDVILWTTMITAYIQEGRSKEALQFYYRLKQEGVKPNKITFVTVLSACTNLGAYIEGKTIHDCIPEKEVMSDVILSNALIAMYQKCGSFADAERLFLKMPRKDVVSCTAMIAAYAEQGRGFEALSLFERMSKMGVSPDKFAFSSLFDACASIAALTDGRVLLSSVVESGVECDRILGNSLISMYGECGIMRDAHHVFRKLKEPDSVSWSAIICAYANHGSCEDVLRLFHGLHEQGLRPSKITYISVLCACSHAGAIDVGYTCFASMIDAAESVLPTQEHYMCLIDLVGRAGCIEEAGQIVLEMPLQPDAISWNTLLGACRVHLIADKGRSAAEHVLELDQQNEVAHVMLANLYASSGRWDESLMVKKALMVATKEC